MSSRNSYLDPQQRKAATILYRALNAAQAAYSAGERSGQALRDLMQKTIEGEPLARMQYISCADRDTLRELDMIEKGALLSMAVYVGKTRLIDNLILN
jgi:pantoate--beta-alanine ligase